MMSKRPLVGICIALCLGILAARYWTLSFWLLSYLAIACALLTLVFQRKNVPSVIFLILAVFFLGAVLFKNTRLIPYDHISRYIGPRSTAAYIKGNVVNDPVVRQQASSIKTSFEFSVNAIKKSGSWQKSSGTILVNMYQDSAVSYGDTLMLRGKLYRPPRFTLSAQLTYDRYLAQKGISGIMSIGRRDMVIVTEQKQRNPLAAAVYQVKHLMKRKIYERLSGVEAGLMQAFLIGERQDIPQQLRDLFVRTGTAHILAWQYTKIPSPSF